MKTIDYVRTDEGLIGWDRQKRELHESGGGIALLSSITAQQFDLIFNAYAAQQKKLDRTQQHLADLTADVTVPPNVSAEILAELKELNRTARSVLTGEASGNPAIAVDTL